jgi:hypothetical protein
MKDGQLFRVKVIKTEDDLPKDGKYFCCHDNGNKNYYPINKRVHSPFENKNYWIFHVDWYLEPIEEQELITDADIEAWAKAKTKEMYDNQEIITVPKLLEFGAKAVLNGEIKHI